jgi:selenocysteine-specific elongation factor
MYVIGTAGHVDHGKSTLITALTGINPDRLKEEREREMTIDLGFAWLQLPDGQEVGIVDVPGHRDFIENMLAGVGGIDAVLLVVAADEGAMPQTREHLAILDLLQVPSGLVVLTKVDLIDDPAWLDLVEGDIHTLLRGTVLQDAPIVRVSSRTRKGIPELLAQVGALLQDRPPRPDLGRPRLPVDRVFSMAGFGTVVTGTLLDGSLRLGDEVEILPSGLKGRVRGLQTHKKKEDVALPGSRTAVNLSGIDLQDVHRGEVVARPGQYTTTRRIDVRFRLLTDASGPIHHGQEVKLFLGTSETVARIRLLGNEKLDPGQEGWLQLELQHPVVALRGDHYILRRPSPSETLGGGTVVDPLPKRRVKRFDLTVIQRLEALSQGSPTEVLLQAGLALGPSSIQQLVQRSRLDPQTAQTALEEALSSRQLIPLEEGSPTPSSALLVITQPGWTLLTNQVSGIFAIYYQEFPLRRGMPREELKSRLKLSATIFPVILRKWIAEGVLAEHGTWIGLPGRDVQFNEQQAAAVKKLLAQFANAPYAPPAVKECQAEVGEEVFKALVDLEELVPVSSEVVFRTADYLRMVDLIRQTINQRGQITLAETRDLFQTSRRYIQALLEHLDASGITVRQGDFHKLK